ncbi:MAG: hypothetical protein AAF902_18575 [Chloroflexota bacterium]
MASNAYAFPRRTSMGTLRDLYQRIPRQQVIAFLLAGALIAFEVFNFDTTKFALADLLGDANFYGVRWASILAFAFCSIDFAGLIKIFTPQMGEDEPAEAWYLMGAWLLGATMNAMMTWYAVSLILSRQPISSEVLSREQLLIYAPIFVAVLVWLTRILFIGSLSVAGEHIFNAKAQTRTRANAPRRSSNSGSYRPRPKPAPRQAAPGPGPYEDQRTRQYATPNHAVQRVAPQRMPVREGTPQRTSRVVRRPSAQFNDQRRSGRY